MSTLYNAGTRTEEEERLTFRFLSISVVDPMADTKECFKYLYMFILVGFFYDDCFIYFAKEYILLDIANGNTRI